MDIFAGTRQLLSYLGYIDHATAYGRILNVVLRSICLASLLFLAIPSFLYNLFLVQSFSDGTEAAVAVVASFGNSVLFSILLWNRQRIFDLMTSIRMKVMERKYTPT